MEPDFSGYATKAGIRCADGRTITPEAFKHMHGQQVPLVWQHGHSDIENVLGHAVLEARSDGVYAYGFFNETKHGQVARELVKRKNIDSLSIYANKIVEKNKQVFHGQIREVSLVLSGANPGAKIDNVAVRHSDGEVDILDEEVVIYHGDSNLEFIEHDDSMDDDDDFEHAEPMTVKEVYDTFNDDQKKVLHYMIAVALEGAQSAAHSDSDDNDLEHQEGNQMPRNIFETPETGSTGAEIRHTVSHDDIKSIVQDAIKGGSLKNAVESYALAHGIDNIDLLFPDAKTLNSRPEFQKRRTEWVNGVLNGTNHSPFSRVKTVTADITQDEARAKGYIKGELKREEWFGLTSRVTSPTTVYKKQKLDRDDVIDITDFDVVAWLKMEMRAMLEEEIARAVLIGDGREIGDVDKIKDPIGAADGIGIRSILNDHELFVTTVNVNVDDANSNYDEVVDAILDGMEYYKGTGSPTFYTTIRTLNKFLKAKDTQGRRLYPTKTDVAAALNVREIVTVDPMVNVPDLVGIIVDLGDYNIGADKGGEVSMFDDFDIDYNQQKYLIETRLSGALTKIKSALVVKKVAGTAVLATPTAPSYNTSTGVVTIPTTTGVDYKNGATNATLTAGAQTAIPSGGTLTVVAVPKTNYYFSNNAEDSWKYSRPSA